jgi:hypothetical protein
MEVLNAEGFHLGSLFLAYKFKKKFENPSAMDFHLIDLEIHCNLPPLVLFRLLKPSFQIQNFLANENPFFEVY